MGEAGLPNTHHHARENPKMYQTGDLPLGSPDVLEETVTLSEAVEGVVALAHSANEAGEGVDDVLALDGTAVLVNLGDGDLARTVVLGLDDSASGRALAGDVTVWNKKSPSAIHSVGNFRSIRIRSSGRFFSQVDDLATVVLHFSGCGG